MGLTASHVLEPVNLSDFLFDSTNAAVCVVDGDFRIREINKAFAECFSVDADLARDVPVGNAMGCCHSVEENKNCGSTTYCTHCEFWKALERTKTENREEPFLTYLARRFYIHGRPERKQLRIHTQGFKQDGESLIAVMMDDITELEANREMIAELAELDPLTGLHTKRTLTTVGETMFQNALRGNLAIAVAIFSIDGLAVITSQHGAGSGDRLIATVAEALAANTRKSDLLARYADEQFALVMHGAKPGTVGEVTAKLRAAVDRKNLDDGGKFGPISLSVGVAERLEATLGSMIRKAESNLLSSTREQ